MLIFDSLARFRRAVQLLLLLLFSACSYAGEVYQVEVSSSGMTRQEAIYEGLIEAVSQVNGVDISAETKSGFSYQELNIATPDASVELSGGQSYIDKDIATKTRGLVKGYQVVNIVQAATGWEADLVVDVVKYETPGISPHSLRKIAVLPPGTKFKSVTVIDSSYPGQEISRQYSQKLVTQLTQSRRFSVMDREYMSEYLRERNLLLSADASVDEQMKIGQVLGVDYLLLGTITEFKAETHHQYNKTLGETVSAGRMQFNADFRIMVMATRQVKWSDTVKVVLSQKEIAGYLKNNDDQGLVDRVLELAAEKVVHSSLDNIYPLKVLKVAGKNAIYLNQGGKMTSAGDHYAVYTPGEKITDPDTGLSIKIDGEQVAMIEITRVEAKYSLARLIKGKLEKIVAGAVVRTAAKQPEAKPFRQKTMTPAW